MTGRDVVLTESDNGRRVEVTEGQMVVVRLAENPTTGYRWAVEKLSGPLAVTREGFERADADRVGAGGVRVLAFAAEGPAWSEVSLVLRRGRSGEPYGTFRFSVRQKGGTG